MIDVILAIFPFIVSLAVEPDQFYRNPVDVIAEIDDEFIMMHCRLKPFESLVDAYSRMGKAEWLKDDVLLPKPLPERYVVVGNAQLGDYNLRIYDIKYEDVGRYKCRTLNKMTDKMYISREAKLYVKGNNQIPEIGYRPNQPLKLNSSGSLDLKPIELTLWCWVQGVSPRPNLSWKVNAKTLNIFLNDVVVEEDPDTHLYTVSSRVTFRVTSKTRHISCTSEVPGSLRPPLTFLIPVNMFQKPVVTFNSPYHSFLHGSRVEFECSSKPDTVYWTWYLETEVLLDCVSTTCVLESLTRQYQYKNVFCRADNDVGMHYAFFQIEIRDLPPVMYNPLLTAGKASHSKPARPGGTKTSPVTSPSRGDPMTLKVGAGVLCVGLSLMATYACFSSPHLRHGESSRVGLQATTLAKVLPRRQRNAAVYRDAGLCSTAPEDRYVTDLLTGDKLVYRRNENDTYGNNWASAYRTNDRYLDSDTLY